EYIKESSHFIRDRHPENFGRKLSHNLGTGFQSFFWCTCSHIPINQTNGFLILLHFTNQLLEFAQLRLHIHLTHGHSPLWKFLHIIILLGPLRIKSTKKCVKMRKKELIYNMHITFTDSAKEKLAPYEGGAHGVLRLVF